MKHVSLIAAAGLATGLAGSAYGSGSLDFSGATGGGDPGDPANSAVTTAWPSTGSIASFDWSGTLNTQAGQPASWGSEAVVNILPEWAPAGSRPVGVALASGQVLTAPTPFSGSVTPLFGGYSASGGTWDFEFIDTFDDGSGPDHVWDSLSFTLSKKNESNAFQYSGSTTGGPTFMRANATFTSVDTDLVNYSVQQITVDTTGTYTISSWQNYDGFLHVYEGSFDPNNPLANGVAANDDTGGISHSAVEATLTAGTPYFIVTNAFDPAGFDGLPGDGDFVNAVTGPGTIVPAPGAAALLGLAGLAGIRRRRA